MRTEQPELNMDTVRRYPNMMLNLPIIPPVGEELLFVIGTAAVICGTEPSRPIHQKRKPLPSFVGSSDI